MLKRKTWFVGVALFATGIVFGTWLDTQEDLVSTVTSEVGDALGVPTAQAQGSEEAPVSPTEARARDVYSPNSEDLAPDEMRVIACGTGMPTSRAAQAAA